MTALLALPLVLLAVQGTTGHSAAQTGDEVKRSITRSVTFMVLPDQAGKLRECRLASVQDPEGQPLPVEFTPSEKYVETACRISLAKGANWLPISDEAGNIKEVEETCMWSKAMPDSPICRAELQGVFAEELPRGLGFGAVFALTSDPGGKLATCRFDAMTELTREAKQVDVKPHELYVADACRKLGNVKWKAPATGSEPPSEFFMFCRYFPSNPVRAFCEKRFGE